MTILSQANRNNWSLYEQALIGGPSTPHWDLCVLTAAGERQAHAYTMQIEERRRAGALPPATRWLVVPDPGGARIGSGGATLNVLLHVLAALDPAAEPTVDEALRLLRGRRVLVIHSGGDSKRLPHYSAFGKLFARVPHELPDGRPSTLFDEFLVSMSGVPLQMHEGVVVASGDVLLLFDHTQLDFSRQGVVGVGMRVPVEVGTRHGVYVADAPAGAVRRFLHKPSREQMEAAGAVGKEARVDVDTGIVWMDPDVAARLVGLAGPSAGWSPAAGGVLDALVAGPTALNLYGDLLGALPPETRQDDYLADTSDGAATDALRAVRERIWTSMRGTSFTMQGVRPARFIHFGTTAEYRDAVALDEAAYRDSGWQRRVQSVAPEEEAGLSVGAVLIATAVETGSVRVGTGTVVEDCRLAGPVAAGYGCVLAGIDHAGPDGLQVDSERVVHALPVRADAGGTGMVARLYGVHDNPKHPADDPRARFLNRPLAEWMERAGVTAADLWPDGRERSLWTARLFPVARNFADAWAAVAWMQRPERATDAQRAAWRAAPRLSLGESYARADLEALLARAREQEDHIRALRFVAALRRGQGATDAGRLLGSRLDTVVRRGERAGRLAEERADALAAMHTWVGAAQAVEHGAGMDFPALARADAMEERAFSLLSDLIQAHTPRAPQVWAKRTRPAGGDRTVRVQAPARVDFGGGWSDTPPHSVERGGVVLNAAITLNGRPPIGVEAALVDEPGFHLASHDLGVSRTFDREDLLHYHDLADPLALHKAAMVLSGLHEFRERGVRLSTGVAIPKGSGLGTSSIMAGAVLAALNRLAGWEATSAELFDQVFCLEQMLTTGGGWQDQVGGLVGGLKLVTTTPGMPQVPVATPVPVPEALQEHLVLVYTGQRRLAKRILRTIMGRYLGNDPVVVGILSEIQDIAREMAQALETGDLETFGLLMARHWEANKAMDPGSSNPFIDDLFDRCRPYVYGHKLAGAGGGGFALLVARSAAARRDLTARLEADYPEREVRVWPCRIADEGLTVTEE